MHMRTSDTDHQLIIDFISKNKEQIVIDYIDGRFCIENKSFVIGESVHCPSMQAFGETIQLAIDNFCFELEKNKIFYKRKTESDDVLLYVWHSSY